MWRYLHYLIQILLSCRTSHVHEVHVGEAASSTENADVDGELEDDGLGEGVRVLGPREERIQHEEMCDDVNHLFSN